VCCDYANLESMPELKNPSPVGRTIMTATVEYCQYNIAKEGEIPRTCGVKLKKVDDWTKTCKSHGEMY
jgi:hypothetical protein